MAAKKKKPASKRPRASAWRFATTPSAAYSLARKIVQIVDRGAQRTAQLHDAMGLEPKHEGATAALQGELDRLAAALARFNAGVVADPARAVREFERTERLLLDVGGAGTARHGLRDVELARAVEHVREWFAHGEPADLGFPVAALGPVASLRPVRNRRDLEQLAQVRAVRIRLKESGPKAAAITMVALASGFGEQTVKRAAGSFRSRK